VAGGKARSRSSSELTRLKVEVRRIARDVLEGRVDRGNAAVALWHRDYSPPAWRNRATAEQKRKGWEMAVRIEKLIAVVLHEAQERQLEEVMETLAEGPESFYGTVLKPPRDEG
jgi:hypothetical protein